jgi:hypothetical protein
MRTRVAGLAAAVLLALNAGGACSVGKADQSTTPSASAPETVTWKAVRARLAAAQRFTYEGGSEFEHGSMRFTQHLRGEVDRVGESSRVTLKIRSPDPRYAVPGAIVVIRVGKRSWLQMTKWSRPNRGKWLDTTKQVPGVVQRTQFETALLAFTPTTDVATLHEFTGFVPLTAAAFLLGLPNLSRAGRVDGDVEMTVRVDSGSAVTHVSLEGGSLTGSSLTGISASVVISSSFEADVNLAPRSVTVKAPPKHLVVTDLVRT